MNVVFDTNVFIHLQSESLSLSEEYASVYASVISRIEALANPALNGEEIDRLEQMFKLTQLVPLDSELAAVATRVRRLTGLKVPDAIIAATAIKHGAQLVTYDLEFFKQKVKINLPELIVVAPDS